LLVTDAQRTGVLMQERSAAVHHGGTWAVPGGAIERGESPVAAALREAREEAGLRRSGLEVVDTLVGTDHVDWSYTYVLAEGERPTDPELARAGSTSWEAARTTWVDLDEVTALRLHPGLRADWDWLREEIVRR
jgi:8-oxo-dGTP pyrophosphatase MutT (NUDIX family)